MKRAKQILFGLVFVGSAVVLGVLFYYYHETRYLADNLVYYKPKLTTQIVDRHGERIANLFDQEHRLYVRYDDIPPRIIEALIAIEDTLFFEHGGVNYEAILRALIKDVIAGKKVEGASTLTQQLVKNTLLTRDKKISRKIKEAMLSLQVEMRLSKEELLERYVNELFLGHGYYGIRTAAEGYFHKDLHQLTLKEIGMLVGLPKAPSFYDPTRNYEIALGRANRVATRMHTLGWIDEAALNEAMAERPVVYNESLTQNRAPYVVDEVMRQLSHMSDLRTGGYTIYTTIDLGMQDLAQEALQMSFQASLERSITALKAKAKYQTVYVEHNGTSVRLRPEEVNATTFESLNGAMVVSENKSGDILAMVGGVDYAKSSYNRATQSRRQPGSAFKPFIYQTGLDMGYSPKTRLADVARTYEFEIDGEIQKWQPKNYEEDFSGILTLREALIHSRNLATINLVTDIGLSVMREELEKRYGFTSLPKDLSLALGSISLSVTELAGYYTAFSNGGVMNESRLIASIAHPTYDTRTFEVKSKTTTTPEQAYLMVDTMRDVVNRGTGKSAKVNGIEIAGKTGTTNKAIDAWFCGFTPTVQAIIWLGNDDNTPMQAGETGGHAAAPAFGYFMQHYLARHPELKRTFDIPEGVIVTRKGDKIEYYTTTSPPPQRQEIDIPQASEEMLF
ncbi:MAG: penicillin-binding protein [Sulfuricurvum sp. PC08-66]|nr:MAG: penicillin-binding protein [Sulfuricurvum sp. PC08-66]